MEKLLIKLSKKALLNGDIPVSCVICKNNKIIASDYNKKVLNNDPTAHAEILCIRKACKKLNTSNLNDCELYSLLYPCGMCREVIKESRIKKVFYILDNSKIITDNVEYKQMDVSNEVLLESKANLVNFFKDKR